MLQLLSAFSTTSKAQWPSLLCHNSKLVTGKTLFEVEGTTAEHTVGKPLELLLKTGEIADLECEWRGCGGL